MTTENYTILDTLVAARELLTPRYAWTQWTSATDKSGRACRVNDPDAVAWCLSGAIERVGGTNSMLGNPTIVDRTISQLESTPTVGGRHLPSYNDDGRRTHASVLRLLDTTIDNLRKAPTT